MITQYKFNDGYKNITNKNVVEKYKTWIEEEIRADLQKNRTGIVSIFLNIEHNLNIACAIRSNNAFLGNNVYIVGKKRYDKRGSVGVHHYENVYYSDNLNEVIKYLHSLGYTIYAVDNIMEYDPKNILDVSFPYKSAFLYGSEGAGLSKSEIELCDKMVYIQMFGSVRSLNVACAATVVEYEYSRRWRE